MLLFFCFKQSLWTISLACCEESVSQLYIINQLPLPPTLPPPSNVEKHAKLRNSFQTPTRVRYSETLKVRGGGGRRVRVLLRWLAV